MKFKAIFLILSSNDNPIYDKFKGVNGEVKVLCTRQEVKYNFNNFIDNLLFLYPDLHRYYNIKLLTGNEQKLNIIYFYNKNFLITNYILFYSLIIGPILYFYIRTFWFVKQLGLNFC